LLDGLREAGVLPVALAYGTSENDALAQQLGLPLLAKFRAQYEPASEAPAAATPVARSGTREQAVEAAPARAAPPASAPVRAVHPGGEPGLVQLAPVRS